MEQKFSHCIKSRLYGYKCNINVYPPRTPLTHAYKLEEYDPISPTATILDISQFLLATGYV